MNEKTTVGGEPVGLEVAGAPNGHRVSATHGERCFERWAAAATPRTGGRLRRSWIRARRSVADRCHPPAARRARPRYELPAGPRCAPDPRARGPGLWRSRRSRRRPVARIRAADPKSAGRGRAVRARLARSRPAAVDLVVEGARWSDRLEYPVPDGCRRRSPAAGSCSANRPGGEEERKHKRRRARQRFRVALHEKDPERVRRRRSGDRPSPGCRARIASTPDVETRTARRRERLHRLDEVEPCSNRRAPVAGV